MNNKRWPELLLQMRQAVLSEIKDHQAMNDPSFNAETMTDRIVLRLSETFGGLQIYLPKGTDMQAFMRGREIYQAFNGHNYKALALQYKLSEIRIRQIVTEHTEIDRKKRQRTLFDE